MKQGWWGWGGFVWSQKKRIGGKGQMGSELNNGVTANLKFFDGETFWLLPLTYFYLPQSARPEPCAWRAR